jgi:TRAP-type C4-dicarboxylate transport system permease large subunit
MGAAGGDREMDVLAMVNVALLLLGIFIEPLPAMLLTVPLPAARWPARCRST